MSGAGQGIRRRIVREIIEAIRQGTAPWQRPWKTSGISWVPRNAVTGRPYRGMNIWLLAAESVIDPRWCTAAQAKQRGWTLLPEARPQTIVLAGHFLAKCNRGGAPLSTPRHMQFFRDYEVYNAIQMRGIPALESARASGFEPVEVADQALRLSGARIHEGGDRALYSWSLDRIALPPREAFASAGDYYATALHELAHWTGHRTRLDRRFGLRGMAEYAREELRAEMASAMLSAHLGLPHDPAGHASYIGSWLKALEREEAELFRATGDAQRIVDAILALAEGKTAAWETLRRPQKRQPNHSRPGKTPSRPIRPVERFALVA